MFFNVKPKLATSMQAQLIIVTHYKFTKHSINCYNLNYVPFSSTQVSYRCLFAQSTNKSIIFSINRNLKDPNKNAKCENNISNIVLNVEINKIPI